MKTPRTRRSFLAAASAATVAAALPFPAIAADTERTDVLEFDLQGISDGRDTGLQIPVTLQRTADGRYVLVLHEFNETRYDELAAVEREEEYDFDRDDLLHDLPVSERTASWLMAQAAAEATPSAPVALPPPPPPVIMDQPEPPYVLGLQDGVFGDVWQGIMVGELSRRGPGGDGPQWSSHTEILVNIRLERTRTAYLFEAAHLEAASGLFTDTRWIRIPTDIGDQMAEAILTPPGRWTQPD